jgi:hypothetical protein
MFPYGLKGKMSFCGCCGTYRCRKVCGFHRWSNGSRRADRAAKKSERQEQKRQIAKENQ